MATLRTLAPAALLAAAPLAAQPAPSLAHLDSLAPVRLEYAIHLADARVGTEVMRLSRTPGGWTVHDSLQNHQERRVGERRLTAALEPVRHHQRIETASPPLLIDVVHEDARLRVTVRRPAQADVPPAIDVAVPPGAHLGGAEWWLLAASHFGVGDTVGVRLLAPMGDAVQQIVLVVEGAERIEVPAGTFDAFRLRGTAASPPVRLWLRRQAPHLVLRQETTGGGTFFLESIR